MSVKEKILYIEPSISVLYIMNLAKAYGSQIIIKKGKGVPGNSIFNVRLVLEDGITEIYGEEAITRFIVQSSNKKPLIGQSNLAFEHWFYYLNKNVREKASLFMTKGKSALPELKQLVAVIQTNLIPNLQAISGGEFVLQALIYSYLNPVASHLSAQMKEIIAKLGEQNQFLSYDVLTKQGDRKQKDISYAEGEFKIQRLTKGQVILPGQGKRNILITSALPYVNNVPHLGNIIGCVLSADVFARYCRLAGHNAVYYCGTDEYGTATENKAQEEGLTCQQICDKYHAIHKDIYEWFDCDFDYFGRTTTSQQTEIAQDIFKKCEANKYTYQEDVEQLFCEKCSKFLADRFVFGNCNLCGFDDARGDQCDGCGKLLNAIDLINPKCKQCENKPIVRSSKHIFLDLPKIKDELEKFINEQSEKGKWSDNSTRISKAWIRDGLKGRCITRDLKWGTKVPLEGFEDKVFYVWFDAPIGYISITANHTSEWELWWKNPNDVELFQFMGKDNIPFHTVIFPSTLISAKDNYTLLHTISTTEYLNYEGGKFSKSRQIGVFGDDAKSTGIPVEVWRYYLLANRPEQSDTVFQWKDFIAKNNNELLANLGNFCNRTITFINKYFDARIPKYSKPHADDEKFVDAMIEKFNEFIDLMERVKIKDGLKAAMGASALCNQFFQDQKPWEQMKQDPERCGSSLNILCNAGVMTIAMMEPFIPSFSAKAYSQLNLKRDAKQDKFYEFIQTDAKKNFYHLITDGHLVSSPQPIFREISEEEAESFKTKFAGKRAK